MDAFGACNGIEAMDRTVSRDAYNSLEELARLHCEGEEWRRIAIDRRSMVAVIAPHGGGIEAGTSELAKALSGDDLSLYCFEGLRVKGNAVLHISSTRFDDPLCLELLTKSQITISLHGCEDRAEVVYVGGLHAEMRKSISEAILAVGFRAIDDSTIHNGDHPANLCNRCRGGRGVQLELSKTMRARMFAGLRASERQTTTRNFESFVSAVRKELLAAEREPSTFASSESPEST